jgi:thiamine-monophosphate kinase
LSGGRDPSKKVSEIGEFGLIERLAARLGPLGSDVVLGIGDDVAAIEIGPDRLLLLTCDVQVGGSHFLPDRCDPRRLGRKVAAINLSDIAAAGGQPRHFLCSLVLPADTDVGFLEALYDGLAEEASRWDADIVGGNVSRGTQLVIDLTLLGEVARDAMLCRSGATPGEQVAVTGRLGAAAAGLWLSLHPESKTDPSIRKLALDAFEVPTPRLVEARTLVRTGGVGAVIDVSDGLAADLGHVCDSSRVGVRIDAGTIPVSDAAAGVARAAGLDPFDWALAGGEDYELIFTAPGEQMERLIAAVLSTADTPVTVIGEIVEESRGRELVLDGGSSRRLDPEGWSHF